MTLDIFYKFPGHFLGKEMRILTWCEQGGIYVVLVMKNQDDNLNNDKGMQ